MNQSITYAGDVEARDHVDDRAIRPASLLFAGLVQVPSYNAPVAVPADIQETALIVVNQFDTVRADTFRLIGD